MIKRNLLKIICSIGGVVGALALTTLSSANEFTFSLTQSEKTTWTNYYNNAKVQYDNTGYYNNYTLQSVELENTPYQVLLNNNGSLINGDIGIPIGITQQENNRYVDSFVDFKDFYIFIYNKSDTIYTFQKSYIYIGEYIGLEIPNNDMLEFWPNTNEYDDYVRVGKGLNVYHVQWDYTLKYFVNKYGSNWYTSDGYGLEVDGAIMFHMDLRNYSTNDLEIYSYYDDTIDTYLNYVNNFNNASSIGYNNGYNDGVVVGQQQGYDNGYTVGQQVGYNNGLTIGYNQGVASVSDTNSTIMGLFGAVANVPITILNGVMGPTLLGVPIVTILLTFLSVLLILWLIKKFIK